MSLEDLRDLYRDWDLDEIEKNMSSFVKEMGRILSGGDFKQPQVFVNYTTRYFILREIAQEKDMEEEKLKVYDTMYLNEVEKSVKDLK